MNEPTRTHFPMDLKAKQVIVRHPDHPERKVEWTVIGGHYSPGDLVTVEYTTGDGAEGVFTIDPVAKVTVAVTVAELQQHAAQVLAELIVRPGWPPVYGWEITYDGGITVQMLLGCDIRPEQARAALAPFADLLDAPITDRPYRHQPDSSRVTVTGTYRDVRVQAWTSVPTAQIANERAEQNGAKP